MDNDPGDHAADSALEHSSRSTRSATRRGSRSRHHIHSRRSSQRLAVIIVWLGLFLATLLVLTIYLGLELAQATKHANKLAAELTDAKLELSSLKPRREEAWQGPLQIAKEQPPALIDIQFDKVIPINKGYLKNIMFSVVNRNGQKRYEYRLVFENTTSRRVYPHARVTLFNKSQKQIGMDEISDYAELAPGESRSHSALMTHLADQEPHRFSVDTKDGVDLPGP
ncbi:MAG: hypothetical protein HYX62_01970 [Gammaproteobacteria bacterium]|nr:hypothetical protein [Gammaproteobacteria bacterium]